MLEFPLIENGRLIVETGLQRDEYNDVSSWIVSFNVDGISAYFPQKGILNDIMP
jgi:hypothetical protein